MTDWQASGMSVMEVSHRSKAFIAVAQEAEADLRELLAIPANYKVLFLQGGATGMFSAIPMNLATADSTVDYVNTGAWSKKAIGEAKRYCKVVTSPPTKRPSNYSSVPAQGALKLTPNAAYFHYTPNETIGGVEFDYVPQVGNVPLVADFSSTILSRPIDVSKFGLIYAGAQKNIGPSGICVVIVRDDLIGKARPGTPSVWDFKAMADEGSMLNTPPTFGWYFAGLVFKWLKKQGGFKAMEAAQPRQGRKALRLHRGQRLLQEPGGEECAFVDERAVHARQARSRQGVLRRGRQGRPREPRRTSFGGRHARVHLQRHVHRRRRGARQVHEGLPGPQRLRGDAATESRERRLHAMNAASGGDFRNRRAVTPGEELDNAIQDPDPQQHQHQGPRAPAARPLRSRLGDQQPRCHPGALGRHAQDWRCPIQLRAVGRAGAGTNNIPVEALSKKGIPVFNAPGANANAVKELVLAGMFLAARNITPGLGLRQVAAG